MQPSQKCRGGAGLWVVGNNALSSENADVQLIAAKTSAASDSLQFHAPAAALCMLGKVIISIDACMHK